MCHYSFIAGCGEQDILVRATPVAQLGLCQYEILLNDFLTGPTTSMGKVHADVWQLTGAIMELIGLLTHLALQPSKTNPSKPVRLQSLHNQFGAYNIQDIRGTSVGVSRKSRNKLYL